MGENDILIAKNRVRKAGENIRDDKATLDDYKAISTWRSIHIPIMTAMINAINRKLNIHNLKAIIVARRLKRLNSIEVKLKRFKEMKLDRMQDIAGVRVVFKEMQQVMIFQNLMKKTYLKGSRKFSLIDTKDYIEKPKDDGYRSIHQIFEYKDASKMRLELQIRTQIQHYWATAVEVLGMKSDSKIKQGEGEYHHKEFFGLCSALFSHIESTTLQDKYKTLSKESVCKKIIALDKKYNIFKSLSALAISSNRIEKQADKKHYYFIVLLDLTNNTLTITGFKKQNYDMAQKSYDTYEKQSKESGNINVVLISLDKLYLLKKAYPNYYLDSGSFIKEIKRELQEAGL